MLVSMFRTIILYALILLALRVMGKRQISQLQTSELVVTLLLSELAVLPIQNKEESLIDGIAPMVVLVAFEVLIALLMMKSERFRQLICGKPVVIIKNGSINQREMKRLRMTTQDLTEQLRHKDAFFMEEVSYAIIETDGMMSVLKRTSDDSLTPKLAGVKVEEQGIETVIISDGTVSSNSLALCGQTEAWALQRVKEAHLELKDVFIMTANSKGKFRIIRREGI